jgi:peptidoglycan/xylan/chitin deacetylase (PgdA/CDA1 family)
MPWKTGYTISDEKTLDDADVKWPNGALCCFTVTIDLSVAKTAEGITAADLASSPAQFAARDGLEGLLRVLDAHGIKATFATPAVTAAAQADTIRSLAAAGHEIAAEGFKHEDPSTLSRDEEARRIAFTTETITRVAGHKPTGWYCLPRSADPFAVGTISPNTMDLLLEAGYRYFGNSPADDIPHWWVTDFASKRAILAMPYYYHFDDQWFLLFPAKGTGLEHADFLARNWRAEFDAQYKRGRMFSMVLHPMHIGWSHRLALLDSFLAHATTRPGVWTAPAGTVAAHWHAAFPAATHLRLEESIWQDYPGSLS